MTRTEPQRIAWDLFEQSFGRLRNRGVGTLVHQSGRTYKVRLAGFERVGDEAVFALDVIEQAAGNA